MLANYRQRAVNAIGRSNSTKMPGFWWWQRTSKQINRRRPERIPRISSSISPKEIYISPKEVIFQTPAAMSTKHQVDSSELNEFCTAYFSAIPLHSFRLTHYDITQNERMITWRHMNAWGGWLWLITSWLTKIDWIELTTSGWNLCNNITRDK